jgi:glycosyltransferase involved in cell wall biosynthesis
MLRTIVQQWVSDGHDVDVLSSQPSYKAGVHNRRLPPNQVTDGANIIRLNLPTEAGKPIARILNTIRLGAALFWQGVIRQRYDVIMISTSPPVLAGWFAALVAKLTGARFIYHCMDVHPEIGKISGEFRNPHVFSLLSRLDKWTCMQAKPVVVLSHDMANTLNSRNEKEKAETLIINNFSLPSDVTGSMELPFSWPSERFILLFAGNIGRFQGLDLLIEAMIHLRHRDDIRLLMMGDGVEKDQLTRMVEEAGARVSFVGHHSVEVAKFSMKRASVGVVSLMPELYRYAYPSKTMTYLEQGCPVLVTVEPISCLAKDIVDNGAGMAVPNGDLEGLVEAIHSLANNPAQIKLMKKNAFDFASREFSPSVVLSRWSFLLKNTDL